MNKILEIFLTFAKIGAFTFGGGYAMIPIIENICVGKKKWITHEEMMDVTVIAESTPGPIAINCATFVGYRQAGLIGAISATIGVVLPSLIIICVIAAFLDHFLEYTLVANAFRGIKIAVGLLIINAAVNMLKKLPKKVIPVLIMFGACLLMLMIDFFAWNFSSIYLMLIAAAIGVIFFAVANAGKKKGGELK